MLRICWLIVLCAALGGPPAWAQKIPVKVVVVAMFERGADTGDVPGEYQLWVEREHLDRVIPLDAGYHSVRMNADGVLGLLTGIGTAKAAASVMALGSDPRFDLSKAYWLVAGIGGGDPADVSLGSAVWAEHVLDGDLAYEIDARDVPKDWPTGFVPLRREVPYAQPVRKDLEGELYTLNAGLVDWAYRLTRDTVLKDSEQMRTSRARFTGFENALRPPFVAKGDTMSSSTFWHGARLDAWANAWTKYYTEGKGNYMISAMEDSGTMQALTFLSHAGRVDLNRVLVLRTVSNYDREAPGSTPAESLKGLVTGSYSAYMPAVEAAEVVGDRVVRYLVGHWAECGERLPR
jgi:purine nucleoside permease